MKSCILSAGKTSDADGNEKKRRHREYDEAGEKIAMPEKGADSLAPSRRHTIAFVIGGRAFFFYASSHRASF